MIPRGGWLGAALTLALVGAAAHAAGGAGQGGQGAAQASDQQAAEIQPWESVAPPDGGSAGAIGGANSLPADGTVSLLGDAELDGIRTKSELISNYDDTDLYTDALPVGKLEVTARIPNRMDSFRSVPCTAWMIAEKLALTAWHCIPGVAEALANAGYKSTGQGQVAFGWDRPTSMPDIYPIRRVVESDQALDYAVIELASGASGIPPGRKYGVIKLLGSAPKEGTPLEIFHHPYGYYKLLLKDPTCKTFRPPAGAAAAQLYHQCDTRGGSSGAPILIYGKAEDGSGRKFPVAVGLHTNGNKTGLADAARDFNFGTATRALAEHSALLRRLACTTEPGGIGCPDERSAIRQFVIYFDWDKSSITPEAAATLDQVAKLLADEPDAQVMLAAHTDQSNSPKYAVGLSERMAASVRAYLASRGAAEGRITSQAFGSSRPAVPLAPGTRELLNRRVEIEVN